MNNRLFLILLLLYCSSSHAQRLVKDINPGTTETTVQHLGNLNKGFVFWASSKYGFEPWISDGTDSGTKLIKDIRPGLSGSWYSDFFYSNDTILYFTAMDNTEYEGLFRTDGSSNGTYKLLTYAEKSPVTILDQGLFYKNKFYFIEPRNNGRTTLWASDGSIAGTTKIFQFNDSGIAYDIHLKEWKGLLFFMAYDHASGLELWTSDGTSAGTKLFKDCYAGVNSGISFYNQNIARSKDYLFFCGQRNQSEGFELFYTKENAESLDLLRDLEPLNGSSSSPRLVEGNDSFFAYNLSQLAFTTNVSFDDNSAFFGNDTNIRYSNIEAIYPIGNQYIAKVETDLYGTELFSCDKHLKNPVLLKDINPGSASGVHYNIHTISDKAYFVGFSNLMLYDIWVTDGTYDGTKIYHEITGGNAPVIMTWNKRLFFVGKMDESVGDELYELNAKNYTISQFNNQEYTVFPNPARAGESLMLANGACHFSCLNQLGQIVWKGQTYDGQSLIPENLANGLYILNISEGENSFQSILLIQ